MQKRTEVTRVGVPVLAVLVLGLAVDVTFVVIGDFTPRTFAWVAISLAVVASIVLTRRLQLLGKSKR